MGKMLRILQVDDCSPRSASCATGRRRICPAGSSNADHSSDAYGEPRTAPARRTVRRLGTAGGGNLLGKIRELKRQGLAILLAEQGVDFSLALADRVYVLEKAASVAAACRRTAR